MKSALQNHIVRRRSYPETIAQSLRKASFGLLFVLLIGGTFLYTRAPGHASAAPNAELNFQARLLTPGGAIVPDGNTYSVQFKLYNVASGGTTQWTETQSGLTVRAGYLSVHLGSVTPFPGTIDWSQQQWLTMNVNSDGEMSPRLQLTSVPAAFHANESDALRSGANLLDADDFAQLAPGTPQVISAAIAALRLNQTGAGGLLQLQNSGVDKFSVAGNGDLTSSGSGTFSGGTLNLGSASQSGALVLYDGSSNTGTLQTDALGQNTIYHLPDAGVANVDICLSSGNCTGSGDINQNGNSFGTSVTIGTNDTFGLNFETDGTNRISVDTSGNVNLLTGGLSIAGTSVLTTGRALQNITGITSSGTITFSSLGAGLVQSSSGGVLSSGIVDRNSATFFNTALTVANGGTGGTSFTTNGVLYGNSSSALQVTSAGTGGQVLLANSSGVPTFTTVSGDAALSDTGVLTIGNGAVTNVKLQNSSISTSFGTNLSGSASVSLGGTLTVNFSATPSFTSVTAATFTSAGALTLSSAASNDISINPSSGIINVGASTTFKTTTGLDIDLNSGSDQTLRLLNNGAGVANLNLADGGLQVGGSLVLSSARALSNLTGISTTGSLVFNSFSGSVGLLQVDASGNVSVTAASGFEVPLTFSNGLTRTGNTVKLGGTLTAATDIALGGNNLTITGSGSVGVGSSGPDRKLDVLDASNPQLRLTQADGSVFVDFQTDSSGNLTIDATGTKVILADDLQVNGNDILDSGGISRLTLGSTTNLTGNFDISGSLVAGNANDFSVNTDGDITSVFTALNGTSTTNGTSGAGGSSTSTSLILNSAANFDVGNYVQINDANCGGTGINPCYAKITAKASNTLTITPALHWTNGATVNEYHVPELGGLDTSQALANRYGRGYFISGVATGNGTTYYNEDGITTSLTTYNFLDGTTDNPNLTTLNIGSGLTTLALGSSGTATTINGSVTFTGNVSAPATGTSGYLQRSGTTISPANGGDTFSTSGNLVTTGSGTITSAGLVTVQSGGANITGGLTLATGVLNLTSGGITSTGSVGGVTGVTFTSGSLNLANGGITNAGSIAGATAITSSGGAVSFNNNSNFNDDVIIGTSSGTITFGGGSAPLVIDSTAFDVTSGGALSGITTVGLSGAITGATSSNTINGLVINAGALSAITGFSQSSGNFAISGSGTFSTGTGAISLNGATTIQLDSTTAFTAKNAGGTAVLGANTSGLVVIVGSTTTDTNQILLSLDSFNAFADTASCTTTTNQGAVYYNTQSNAVRGCVNGGWEDMISSASLGLQLYGVVPDSGANPGDISGITGAANGPCKVTWASTTTVNINACVAFSGGRKVIAAAQSGVSVAGNGTKYICLQGTDNQPNVSASLPGFSPGSPVLCLSQIVVSGGNIADMYDLRTFTTTTKEFATVNSANTVPGMPVVMSTARLVVTTNTTGAAKVRGVIVATSGAASTTTINAIIATNGVQWVRANAGTAGDYVETINSVGFAATAANAPAPLNGAYATLGIAQTAFSTLCSTSANCEGSLLVNLSLR